jgi:peptidoglycan biosynthesis protein MviN/MurJ (putative lipid II flippase)
MQVESRTGNAGAEDGELGRSAAGVAVWTLLSRTMGLARLLVIGAVLGPTYLANVFQSGYTLPNNVFTIFAGPMVAMVLVPAVVRASAGSELTAAREVLARVAGRLITIALCAAGALAALSPALGATLVLGVPEPDHRRAWLLATVLILFVAPQIVLYTLVSLAVAAQQSRGRFALPAGLPTVESVGTIVTVLVAGRMFGTGFDVGAAPVGMVVWLGAASTASVALHAALQLAGVARVGLLVRPRWGLARVPEAGDCVRRMARSMPVAAAPAATNYLLAVIASTVPGGALVVQLSSTVLYALSFVGSRAVSMAALPRLARAAADQDWIRFAVAWRRCLHYATLAALPWLCLLLAFGAPAADLLANGQFRDGRLVHELAACLAVAAIGQLIAGLHDLGRQALFARLDDRGPRLASMASLSAGALVAVAALALPAHGPRLLALTVAVAVGEAAAATTVITRLGRRISPEPLISLPAGGRAALATLAMLPAVGAGALLLRHAHPDRVGALALLAGTSVVAVAVFAAAVRLLHRRPASF